MDKYDVFSNYILIYFIDTGGSDFNYEEDGTFIEYFNSKEEVIEFTNKKNSEYKNGFSVEFCGELKRQIKLEPTQITTVTKYDIVD